MPYPEMMQESIAKVEETRSRRMREDFPRLSLEERQRLLEAYHPDYRRETFRPLAVGPNKGDLVPNELADLLEARSRIDPDNFDLSRIDYETDVLTSVAEVRGRQRLFGRKSKALMCSSRRNCVGATPTP